MADGKRPLTTPSDAHRERGRSTDLSVAELGPTASLRGAGFRTISSASGSNRVARQWALALLSAFIGDNRPLSAPIRGLVLVSWERAYFLLQSQMLRMLAQANG
jgi:hypothetical protein